jgi:hypothetical protein
VHTSATLNAFSSWRHSSGPRGTTSSCSFESAKDVKDAVVSDDGCMLRIGTTIDPK